MAQQQRKALRVRGLAGLRSNFLQADRYIMGQTRKVNQEAADAVQFWTEAFSARLTTYMSKHVEQHISPSGAAFRVGWEASTFRRDGFRFYPIYPEYGTRVMKATPALRPAYNLVAPDYKRKMAAVHQRAIARIAAKSGKD